MGAGFHAYVCEFMDTLLEKSPQEFEVNDPTGYYHQRNFDHLKYDIYYRWLLDVGRYIMEQKDKVKDLCISWQVNYYLPKEKKGYIITPVGYISEEMFEPDRIEDLANTFFIWNNKEKDSMFYRNAAMNLLWKECYFEYSTMNDKTMDITNSILDYLEMAYEKNPTLALPMLEYRELCETMDREPKISNPVSMINIPKIGYRREMIEYQLGNWNIPVDGCAERRVVSDENALIFMAPYHKDDESWRWMYKISSMAFEKEIHKFLPMIKDDEAHEEFEYEGVKGIVSLTTDEEYRLIHAQYVWKNETLLLQLYVNLTVDEKPLLDLIKHVRYRSFSTELKAN